MRIAPPLLAGLFSLALTCGALAAEPATGKLQLELNGLQPAASACRVTFLATNGLDATIDKAVFELAVFGSDGGIERVVSLAFTNLTAGKSKVVQFDLKDIACDNVSRVLVNDITGCEGAGIAPTACLDNLQPGTRTAVRFGI